jgi:hypothetical protein
MHNTFIIFLTLSVLQKRFSFSVRVPQILRSLEADMIVNFKTREISRGTRKLSEHPR